MRAGTWRHLAEFYTAPGFTSELMHLYLATDLRPADGERLGPDEDEHLCSSGSPGATRWLPPSVASSATPRRSWPALARVEADDAYLRRPVGHSTSPARRPVRGLGPAVRRTAMPLSGS